MMQERKSKKILIYFFLLLIVGTINNININGLKLQSIKDINIVGLDTKDKNILLKKIKNLNTNNIFSINKSDLINEIEENSLVITIEAGSITHWQKYIKNEGFNFGIDQFGESAPYKEVYDHFNLTEDKITSYIQTKLRK